MSLAQERRGCEAKLRKKRIEFGEMMEDVARKHQLKIARDTLRMSDVGALIMGGMTKEEARDFLRKYGGKK